MAVQTVQRWWAASGSLIAGPIRFNLPVPCYLPEENLRAMGSAVSIAADNGSADVIRDLWHHVSAWEASPSMEALNYPPHFTFAICKDLEPVDLWKNLS